MTQSTFNPYRGMEPGEVAFKQLAFFLTLGEPPCFPLSVHETYKENNPQ